MMRKRVFLCLITILLIAAVDSKEETMMRLDMAHRDTIWPNKIRRLEEVISDDQKRHSMISRKRMIKRGVNMELGAGADYGVAQYLTEIDVGTPGKKFRVVVDTGSELTWVNCKYRGRPNKKGEKRSVFKAEESITFKPVGCFTQTCKNDLSSLFSLAICPNPSTPCSYDYRYADGSSAQGVFAKETLTVGLTNGRKARLNDLLIGCSNSFNGGSFRGADGVLGIAFSDFALTARATSLFGGKLSYCLVDHLANKNVSNYLIFGATSFNKTVARRSTPLDLSVIPPFYAISIVGVTIGDEMLDIPKKVWDATKGGGTIIDSGASLTLLDEAAYQPVVKGLARYLKECERVKLDVPIEYCFDTAKCKFNESKMPQLTFHFKGGARFDPHRRSYLIDAAPGVKCLGFTSVGTPATNVIGNIMQQNYMWEFDLMASTLSYAPSKCR